jgi:SnoaL-like domain
MIDRHDAEQLILRSWWLIDTQGGLGVEALFTEDGSVGFGPAVNRGRDGIRLVYQLRRQRGDRVARHLVTNMQCTSGPSPLVVQYSLILFAADGTAPAPTTAPAAVFDVRDVVVAQSDSGCGPLIAERALTTVFSDPGATMAVSFDKPAAQLGGRS